MAKQTIYPTITAEELAQQFHEAYERLAGSFGYKTREASAKPWAEIPNDNKLLMIAVAGEVLEILYQDTRTKNRVEEMQKDPDK